MNCKKTSECLSKQQDDTFTAAMTATASKVTADKVRKMWHITHVEEHIFALCHIL